MSAINRLALFAILQWAAHIAAQTYSIDAVDAYQPQHFVVTIPGHSNTTLRFNTPDTLDSRQIAHIRASWGSIVEPSLENELIAYEAQDLSASRSLAFLGFFGGNGKAVTTFGETSGHLEDLGVSMSAASEMMGVFYEEAVRVHDITTECKINNMDNRFSISGNVVLLSMEGRLELADTNEVVSYRALSSMGVFASSATSEALANTECEFMRKPTAAPTSAPTGSPTPSPTRSPTPTPTFARTLSPTAAPTSPPGTHDPVPAPRVAPLL